METRELAQIDTRYEGLRLKDKRKERLLLSSIGEKGILEPVYVIQTSESDCLLVDGFKRFRCARKLKLGLLPVESLESHAVPGLIKFLKRCNEKGLSQIEQACLVDELHSRHNLSIVELAGHLDKSPSWVRMRLGILREMPQVVKSLIMSGQFPFRNYAYSLRPFTRVPNTPNKDLVSFVEKVSGKGLSTRDIDRLAKCYFNGNPDMKAQIMQGQLDWTLEQIKHKEQANQLPSHSLEEKEDKTLRQLQWLLVNMNRLAASLPESDFKSPAFFKQGAELAGKILKRTDYFISTLREFYDRAAKACGRDNASSTRPESG